MYWKKNYISRIGRRVRFDYFACIWLVSRPFWLFCKHFGFVFRNTTLVGTARLLFENNNTTLHNSFPYDGRPIVSDAFEISSFSIAQFVVLSACYALGAGHQRPNTSRNPTINTVFLRFYYRKVVQCRTVRL